MKECHKPFRCFLISKSIRVRSLIYEFRFWAVVELVNQILQLISIFLNCFEAKLGLGKNEQFIQKSSQQVSEHRKQKEWKSIYLKSSKNDSPFSFYSHSQSKYHTSMKKFKKENTDWSFMKDKDMLERRKQSE